MAPEIKKNQSREELEEQLENLISGVGGYPMWIGHCVIDCPLPKSFECPTCGTICEHPNFDSPSITLILEIVDSITNMSGYDAKIDSSEFCIKCSGGVNVRRPKLKFSIRFKGDNEYHVVETNVLRDYQVLCSLLENYLCWDHKQIDKQYYNEKRLRIIKKMTGIDYHK